MKCEPGFNNLCLISVYMRVKRKRKKRRTKRRKRRRKKRGKGKDKIHRPPHPPMIEKGLTEISFKTLGHEVPCSQ